MAIDMKRLCDQAFFSVADIQNATEAIEQARQKYFEKTKAGAFSIDVVAPAEPDEEWVRERLMRPLVYFCESEGTPLPNCPGTFLSLFVGSTLYCIAVSDVFAWAVEQLGADPQQLVREYGTHEVETAMR